MAKPIPAIGQLRERVTFQDQTQAEGDIGDIVTTWADIASTPTVWGRMDPQNERTLTVAARDEALFTWILTVRYRTDLTVQMRVVWRGRIFDIDGFDNKDERRQYLRLRLKERKAGATGS